MGKIQRNDLNELTNCAKMVYHVRLADVCDKVEESYLLGYVTLLWKMCRNYIILFHLQPISA